MKLQFPFPYPAIFALTQPRKTHLQVDGISFTADHLEGMKEANTIWRWPYEGIEAMTFIWKKGSSGMWNMLFGSMFSRIEDEFLVQHQGQVYRFALEWDSKYRRQELVALFLYLYRRLPGFSEKNHLGVPVFLSEALPLEEIHERIKDTD